VTIAIIPARGGSTRIPDKNIREFCGKPIIGYSIEVAEASGLFDEIIVSTDDRRIADVAKEFGASVPFMRPANLADAHSGTSAVVRHALQWLGENRRCPAFACCIYATAPLLNPVYLERGIRELEASSKAYAFSVTTFPFPILRALHIDDSGCLHPSFPEYIQSRSQDLLVQYHDAGQFYWGRSEAFLAEKPVFSPHSIPIILPRYLVQDIDEEEDWARAEAMYKVLQELALQ
jgi:N-acylneuraminate cytidylyltransferase